MKKLIYKKAWVAFNIGRGLFEAIPMDNHHCGNCAFVHSKSCGKYACHAEDRKDKQNISFDKL